MRGRTATTHACLNEALGTFAKLHSGYLRDLKLLTFPLLRGIDVCGQTLDILTAAPTEVVLDEATIKAKANPAISCSGSGI